MSKRLLYGKEVKIKGQDVEFISDNPIVIPELEVESLIATTVTATGSLNGELGDQSWIHGQHNVTGALIIPSGVTVSVDGIGGRMVRVQIRPQTLSVPAAAVATAPISIIGCIPVGYRPPDDKQIAPCIVIANNVAIMGNARITTGGDVNIYAGLNTESFTNTQLTALSSSISVFYSAS